MSERITVTLPSSLYQQLQHVKNKFNVSQICQEAIEKKVTMEKLKMQGIPAKEKAISRLRLEKQSAHAEWTEIGFKDGLEAAEELSYEDFQSLLQGELSDDLRQWLYDKQFDEGVFRNEAAYLEGWTKGALSFWEEVEDQL